jgi:fimbrial chaperone protein
VRRNYIIGTILVFFLLLHSQASAGSFKAVPVKVFLDAQAKTTILTIINQGEEKVTVQLDAKTWQQDDAGKDLYSETKDLIFFPRIATIEKGEEQIVRIGYQGIQENREKTYRLFIQELPVSKPGEMQLKLALTMSIPIFVQPVKEGPMDWSVEAAGLSEETLRVKVRNGGNKHIMVGRITTSGIDETGSEVFSRETAGWYTLAGTSKIFQIPVTHESCLKIKTLQVTTEVEKDKKTFSLNVEKGMCTRKQEEAPKRMKEKKTP